MIVTPQEQTILGAISDAQLSCADVADKTGIPVQNVRVVVRRLYRHGFLIRTCVKHVPNRLGDGNFHFEYKVVQHEGA